MLDFMTSSKKQDFLEIFLAQDNDVALLETLAKAQGEKEDFLSLLERQKNGALSIFIARYGGTDVGYVIYNRQPRYAPFARFNVPEIQDLNIIPDQRCKGYGQQLVTYCENIARAENCQEIGIAVSVEARYAAAQRLYLRAGYLPDGQGACYDRNPVHPNTRYPVDGQLTLMLTKKL